MEKDNTLINTYIKCVLDELKLKGLDFTGDFSVNEYGDSFITFNNNQHQFHFKLNVKGDFCDLPTPIYLSQIIYKDFIKLYNLRSVNLRLIDILNLLFKCYMRKKKHSNMVCYADENTRNKIVVVDGDCVVFPVKDVWQDENFIHLVIDEDFINK